MTATDDFPDPSREPVRLADLLADALDRLAGACAAERVHERRARQTDEGGAP